MNADNIIVAKKIVPFLRDTGITKFEKKVSSLLNSRRLPEEGWEDSEILMFIQQLSQMDSNNFAVGVGEREGRVFSRIVRDRCYGLTHGMGRSGSLGGAQPKAAGSSLIVALTNYFVLQMLNEAGDPEVKEVCVVPLCTGMSLFLCLTSLKKERPKSKHVIWCRCDQKSAMKSVNLAGLELVVVEGIIQGDSIITNEKEILAKMDELGEEKICCVMSTSSCFAPRVCDNLEGISKLCKERNVPHLINNAYGVQSREIMKKIARATRVGRVDGYVQSTGNFIL